MEKMILLCAWCPKEKVSKISEFQKVSHGICPGCIKKYFPQVAESVLKKVA